MSIPFAVLILALIVCQTVGQRAKWYNCPSSCTGECRCASEKAPIANPPQFILLTHDDAVTSFSFSTVLDALTGLTNPNGCDLPATFFVSIRESLDHLIHHLYMSNHEIADHTFNHPHLPNEAEIMSAIDWIHTNANVPIEEIRGFRAPYLEHDVAQRRTLQKLGLKYDASITEQPGEKQLFPYSLDHGIAVDCSKGTGTCNPRESYPGMWSVPLWTLPRATSMDIPGDVYAQYSREFRTKLYGNRAPLGIFFHSGWLRTNLGAVRKFLKQALEASPDVWVVTNWQLIEYMKNPVSAAVYRRQMTKSKFCPRSPKGPAPPKDGCVFGSWDKNLYRCTCQAENITNSNGYCRGSDRSCTVPKLFTNGIWHCPGQQPNSFLLQLQKLTSIVQNAAQQHIPVAAKRSIQDGVQNVRNQGLTSKVKESPFYLWTNSDHKYDPQTGKHYFYGIEIPNLPVD